MQTFHAKTEHRAVIKHVPQGVRIRFAPRGKCVELVFDVGIVSVCIPVLGALFIVPFLQGFAMISMMYSKTCQRRHPTGTLL
jgi:hypothetical protein